MKKENQDEGLSNSILLLLTSVVIGFAVAGTIWFFLFVVHQVQTLAHTTPLHELAVNHAQADYRLLLALPICGLLVGLLVYYLMPGRANKGLAHVVEADLNQASKLSLREGLGVGLASAVSIGAGASVGRYGPSVHIGAALGSALSNLFPSLRKQRRILFAGGIAAAISACFHAPFAGILFAHEVFLGRLSLRAFAPVTVASVSASAAAYGLGVHIKGIPVAMDSPYHYWYEYFFFVALGVLGAFMAMLFMRILLWTVPTIQKLPIDTRLRPAIGGLILAIIGLQFPHVLGMGAEASTHAAVFQQFPLWLMLSLLFLKMATTSLSLGFGFSGGVFGPVLFIGAMLGGAFAAFADQMTGLALSPLALYALVGMGAVISPVIGAPITTILMVFEITKDYPATTAVMLAVVVAQVISRHLWGASLFAKQLKGRGMDLMESQEMRDLRQQTVEQIMQVVPTIEQNIKNSSSVIEAKTTLDTLMDRINSPEQWPIMVEKQGKTVGILDRETMLAHWMNVHQKTHNRDG
ncbi:MAG: chloride channel protein [Magnetococcales bacterium]|nr:chloride channel protein [Magnetococcales bacterium]